MADKTHFSAEGFSGVVRTTAIEDLIKDLEQEQRNVSAVLKVLRPMWQILNSEFQALNDKWLSLEKRISALKQGQLELET